MNYSTAVSERYSRQTILVAVDMFEQLERASLRRLILGFGSTLATEIGETGSRRDQLNRLVTFIDHFPDYRDDDGTPIQNAVIEKAVSLLRRQYPWSEEPQNESAFRRALERDGFTIVDGALRRMLPSEVQLPESESEIERMLAKHDLAIARGHLDQARAAHTRGDWAAANAQIRSFFDATLDGITERLDPTAANLGSGHPRRERLAQLGFLSAQLNEWNAHGGGFINGLSRRLHPEGSHPGLSSEEDSTFRLHVVLLTLQLLLGRFDVQT